MSGPKKEFLMTKKVVLKVVVHDEKQKQKVMKSVSSLSGIESIDMDMNEKKLTVVGAIDPIQVVEKLKKSCYTEILTVEPAKEPEKKKKESEKISEPWELYKNHCPHYTQCYYVYCAEENPNSCIIC